MARGAGSANTSTPLRTTRVTAHVTVQYVIDTSTAWSKVREWSRRYLPCEIAGTAGEFGAAGVTYATTGSLAAAAVAATIGASLGYYAAAYITALRWCYAGQIRRGFPARMLMANLLALRSVAIEFGPAELIDSIAVRPLAFYAGPLIFGNVAAGWIFGKLISDLAFYSCAIVSYERFNGLLARHRPEPGMEEEDDRESATTIATA